MTEQVLLCEVFQNSTNHSCAEPSFFFRRSASIHPGHPYSSTDTAITRKKSSIILSEISDFHMIDYQSISVNAFPKRMLTSLSEDEILLPRNLNLTTKLRGSLFIAHKLCLICVQVEAKIFSCLIKTIQQVFSLG